MQEGKSFVVHPEKYLANLEVLHTELKDYLNQPDLPTQKGLRILMTGCPQDKGSDKAIRIAEELGLPFLHIETDYSESDVEQLKTRLEAFIEPSE